MPCPLYTVDAFADAPFRGNPAAVCFAPEGASDAWLQAVAAEMALSETAFPTPDDDGGWGLRWFTPAAEVDLCGHATLATAHVLWSTGRADGALRFATRSGELRAERRGDRIALDFPATRPEPAEAPDGLFEALGARGRVLRSRFDVMVVLDRPDDVRALAPDLRRLAEVDARGVIATAAAGGDPDFVSRFFAPRVGVDEDPVTGSAHCALAPYWASELGRDALVGEQLSRRGGTVGVELRGERVTLLGAAVTVLEGRLAVDP